MAFFSMKTRFFAGNSSRSHKLMFSNVCLFVNGWAFLLEGEKMVTMEMSIISLSLICITIVFCREEGTPIFAEGCRGATRVPVRFVNFTS